MVQVIELPPRLSEGSIDIASGNIRFEYEGADHVNFRTTGISVEGAAGPRLLYRSQRGTLAAPTRTRWNKR